MERDRMVERYAMSAMGSLRIELGQYDNGRIPLSTEVTLLTGKTAFDCSDVVDRGILLGTELPHFTLDEVMTKRITDTVSRLQSILHHASGLIPEQSSTFQFDPHGVLVNLLLGAHDVAQMNAGGIENTDTAGNEEF
jgi:hypothetical protein